jgi:hypothetical protein
MPKDAEDSRDDQRSHGSLLNHMTEYSCKIQKTPPRGADHPSEAPFSNGAPGRRPGAGRHTLCLRGKNPAGPVARAGCMTQRLNWVKNDPDGPETPLPDYDGERTSSGPVGMSQTLKLGSQGAQLGSPLYPQEQTSSAGRVRSVSCQARGSCNGTTSVSFDHLICAHEFECGRQSIPRVVDATGGSFCGGDRWSFRVRAGDMDNSARFYRFLRIVDQPIGQGQTGLNLDAVAEIAAQSHGF